MVGFMLYPILLLACSQGSTHIKYWSDVSFLFCHYISLYSYGLGVTVISVIV